MHQHIILWTIFTMAFIALGHLTFFQPSLNILKMPVFGWQNRVFKQTAFMASGRTTIALNKIMKLILQIIPFFLAITCFAQPTGHQRIFFEILDQGDTIHFENNFRKGEIGSKQNLVYKNYQLSDIRKDKTGFEFYRRDEFIDKTLMIDDHHIQIIRNGTDIMQVEIINAFNVYFLSIAFQKGNFKMVVNDGKENQWNVNTLPYKLMNTNSNVYNITPNDWSTFEVTSDKTEQDYFISEQFEQQQLLAKPVIPEEDPNFRNPRRINMLRVETADYNFDGHEDFRQQSKKSPSGWDVFVYNPKLESYKKDTLLSKFEVFNDNKLEIS